MEFEKALHILLAHWRVSRQRDMAHLIGIVSDFLTAQRPAITGRSFRVRHALWTKRLEALDPADVGPLLSPVLDGGSIESKLQRLKLLSIHPPDPRIGRALAEIVWEPHFRSFASNRFYVQLFQLLAFHADGEIRDQLAVDIQAEYRGPFENHLLNFKKECLAAMTFEEQPLAAAEAAAVKRLWWWLGEEEAPAAELNELLAVLDIGEAPLQVYKKKRELIEVRDARADFIRQIGESPNDDSLRLVFADWLLEHNDLWGELIQLQYQRLEGGAGPEELRRERELLQQYGEEWQGPLNKNAGVVNVVFERGFPVSCRLEEHPEMTRHGADRATGHPFWGTIRDVVGHHERAHQLLLHPVTRHLRRLVSLNFDVLFSLAITKVERAIEVIEVQTHQSTRGWRSLAHTKSLPRLRHLVLRYDVREMEDIEHFRAFLWEQPLMRQLDIFGIETRARLLGVWWEELSGSIGFNGSRFEIYVLTPGLQDVQLTLCRVRGNWGRLEIRTPSSGRMRTQHMADLLRQIPRNCLSQLVFQDLGDRRPLLEEVARERQPRASISWSRGK